MDKDNKHTVLVVDDSPALVELYVQWLTPDYCVRSATSGIEALQQADESVDTVLLDRQMPDLSGEEVAGVLRDREDDLRIVFVSSLDPDFGALAVTPDDYLVKPVSKDELVAVVRPDETLSE